MFLLSKIWPEIKFSFILGLLIIPESLLLSVFQNSSLHRKLFGKYYGLW
jgi:hypothetical protein